MTKDQKPSIRKFLTPISILVAMLVCVAAVVSGRSITHVLSEFPNLSDDQEPKHQALTSSPEEIVVDQSSSTSEEIVVDQSSSTLEEELDQEKVASCDALEYVEVIGDAAPEIISEEGTYHCIYNYQFSNTHPDSSIKISWKHIDSTYSKGPYWTHPDLKPGAIYNIQLRNDLAANGVETFVDAKYLMAWFDSEECNLLLRNFRGTEEEPDLMLKSGLPWLELSNPCAP